jgi:hypothetical protein
MTLQPGEGVALELAARIPGARMRLTPVHMEYLYGTSFASQSVDAYERLILDALLGDATLFTRSDEVEAQWRIVDPVLRAWASSPEPPPRWIERARRGAADPETGPPLARDLNRVRRRESLARRRGHGPRAGGAVGELAHTLQRAVLDLAHALGAESEHDGELAQRAGRRRSEPVPRPDHHALALTEAPHERGDPLDVQPRDRVVVRVLRARVGQHVLQAQPGLVLAGPRSTARTWR